MLHIYRTLMNFLACSYAIMKQFTLFIKINYTIKKVMKLFWQHTLPKTIHGGTLIQILHTSFSNQPCCISKETLNSIYIYQQGIIQLIYFNYTRVLLFQACGRLLMSTGCFCILMSFKRL